MEPLSSSQNTELEPVAAVPKVELEPKAELPNGSQPWNLELQQPELEPLSSSHVQIAEPVPVVPETDNVVQLSEANGNRKKMGTVQSKKVSKTKKGQGKRRVVPNDSERAALFKACRELLELGLKLEGKRGEIVTQEMLGKQAGVAKTKAAWWLTNRSQFELKEAFV